jgi:hypothetical protein
MPLASSGVAVRSLTGEAGCLIRQAFLLVDEVVWLCVEAPSLAREAFCLMAGAIGLGDEAPRVSSEAVLPDG